MVTSPVGSLANKDETESMLVILEAVGKEKQPSEIDQLLSLLPSEIKENKEYSIRFLLLTAILDQQAKTGSARATALSICKIYGEELFTNPIKIIKDFHKLETIQQDYRVSPAVGRVLPRFGWFVLRVGGFLDYEIILGKNKLSEIFNQCSTSVEALDKLYENPIIRSILRDKAARMYISWIGHPDIGVDVSNGVWAKKDFLMPVDGHVGKIFSRSGMVKEVIHEGRKDSSSRWSVIKAAQMRENIQQVVREYGKDIILVDHGAFQIGLNCCPDNLEDICCDACQEGCTLNLLQNNKICVLSRFCKRNLTWRAF